MRPILCTTLLLIANFLTAQTRLITGTVTDPAGQALPGATIRVKDAALGASTAADGSYRLDVPLEFNTLVFSYLGYQTLEVAIAGRQTIDVRLEEAAGTLDEVVVTGFGTQSKRLITSAISSVGPEVFQNIPATDFQNMLQGRMPGVVLTNSSGYANTEPNIRIRGVGSFSAGNQPLVVVDGLVLSGRVNSSYAYGTPFATNPFINLNPNDIESVEVLKDAAASAIYGSRGSNGVILITTKSGRFNSQPRVHLGYWAGFSEASKTLELLSGPEWAESYNQAAINAGLPPVWDVDAQSSTNWVELGSQNGFKQEMNASMSGGTNSTKYYVGGTVRDEEGILKNNAFQRYAVRANIDQLIGEKVTVGIALAPSRVKTNRLDDYYSPFYNTIWTPPNIEAFDENGIPFGYADIGFQGSPYTNLVESHGDISSTQILANSYLRYTPVPNLSVQTAFAVESAQHDVRFKFGSRTFDGYPAGRGTVSHQETLNYNWTALATWRNHFGHKHELDVTAGFNLTKESLTTDFREGTDYADDRLLNIGAAAQIVTNTSNYTEAGFTGLLARANYAYAGKYLLTLSTRYDGSSRFGSENRYGFFPAISAGWIISEEGFFNPDYVNFLKLRSSFGIAGNAEIGDYAARGLARFGQNYNGLPGYDIQNIENEQLSWEKNIQWDAGLEFALFKNRIRGSLDYYIKDTRDLLLEVPIPATNGFTTLSQNAGGVRNQGFEFDLAADILTGAFQWTVQLNGATLKNKVLELIDTDGDGLDNDLNTDGRFLYRPGLSIGSFYLVEFAGVDPDNGDALYWNADKTQKLPNVISDANRQVVGKSLPDFTGGFSNSFRYKNFELTAFFQFKTGYQIYMLDGGACSGVWTYTNVLKDCADRVWTPENRYTDIPQNRLFQGNGAGRTSRNVYDGDYLRLKNLTLGYAFPPFGARNNRLYVFASCQNLWIWTNYPGLDPDANIYSARQAEQGATLSPPPAERTYTMGFNLAF